MPESQMGLSKTSLILLGASLGQLIPDPSDILHFAFFLPWLSNSVNQANALLYTFVSIFDWYVASAIWFLFVLLISKTYGNRFGNEFTLAIGLISLGILISLIGRFILIGTFF